MSQVQREIEKVFVVFSDETSKMPAKSLVPALRCAGYLIEDGFEHSANRESHIGLEEFRLLAKNAESQELTREKVEESFRYYDPEDTGYIKACEFKRILSSGDNALSEADIKTIFEQFPPNDQGMICYSLPIGYMFEDPVNK